MGWSIGYDRKWARDIGYGVPAFCDHPGCDTEIDRGLAYVCGGELYGGDNGCGLYFCGKHQTATFQRCERCAKGSVVTFCAKPDTSKWIRHKLTDASWQQWRDENPSDVARLNSELSLRAQAGGATEGCTTKADKTSSDFSASSPIRAQGLQPCGCWIDVDGYARCRCEVHKAEREALLAASPPSEASAETAGSREIAEFVERLEDCADKCTIYGPADQLRGLISQAAALLSSFTASASPPPAVALAEQLEQALLRYGKHDAGCTRQNGKGRCSCGFSRLADADGLLEKAAATLRGEQG